MNTKVLITFLAIIAVGLGAYSLGRNQLNLPQVNQSPTQIEDTAEDWTVYENNLGFSLRYPPNELIACFPNDQVQFNLWKAPFDCPDGQDAPFEVQVAIDSQYKPYGVLVGTENIQVDGRNSTKYSYIYTEEHGIMAEFESTEVVIPYKGRFIILSSLSGLGATPEEKTEEKNRFNQILSTFKFTD